ncbi:hypothetical protein GFS31_43740 (plasmid) [Leptolyngbya sp. BL0902]|nr:hypothetical protein GFS31_43740 [Leptolyngbya sp. BL0902]
MFQSLRGFGVDWSFFVRWVKRTTVKFQSLRGFGVDWSHPCHHAPIIRERFNP